MNVRCLAIVSILLLLRAGVHAQTPQYQGDLKELFKGPDSSAAWLSDMRAWRTDEKKKLGYNDSVYRNPALGWVKRCFIYAQMMASDRFFYDAEKRVYTVDRYLDDVERRYGGLDGVLIWPTYPNMGVDDRNQFDWVEGMPGGLEGVRRMVQDFKKRGVRVFFPIMIWDKGTRPIGLSMPVALIKEMKAIGADGMNGDTMFGITGDFQHASDSLGYPVVLQPEVAINDLKMVEWNTMSWGYFWDYTDVPGVSVYKWLEPAHRVIVTNRWVIDKTDDLQSAWFNGVGYNAWENIWGIWNQVPERYAVMIRRMAAIYHHFPDVWNSPEWQPHIPTLQKGIFASVFPGAGERVYTLINRDSLDRDGRQLMLPFAANMHYYDIYHGKELTPEQEGDKVYLRFPMEGRGLGAILATRTAEPKTFLEKMQGLSAQPLKVLSDEWTALPQSIVPIKAAPHAAAGMIAVPGIKDFVFESTGTMIEGDELPMAVGVQHPWESHPSRSQKHTMDIPAFYIDKYPVTNREFKRFLDASHYRPGDDHNFLRDWKNGAYPSGWADKPVTWVSIEDARAYAAWAGKRLPHEWEWQYAAQGSDGRVYPWGNTMDPAAVPPPDTVRQLREPSGVGAFPRGASPFGVMDLVGNVWQWTDEYTDLHTRSAILKGGCYWHAMGSEWYFPRAYELNKYNKYLLLSPGEDRAATIGFRCAGDQ
jgi:gamma-glutamyl hercynylcysteine S-oxide synthase